MCAALTKSEAAHRQLAAAIRMYFADGDLVAIHTLACAAREIYEKHCEKADIDRMFNHIRATHNETDKRIWEILNGARNFFKHPGESLDEVIELNDSDNKAMLFIACHDCAMLCGENQPIESQVFNIWFLATEFPSADQTDDREKAAELLGLMESQFPGLKTASPAEQKKIGLHFLSEVDSGRLPSMPNQTN